MPSTVRVRYLFCLAIAAASALNLVLALRIQLEATAGRDPYQIIPELAEDGARLLGEEERVLFLSDRDDAGKKNREFFVAQYALAPVLLSRVARHRIESCEVKALTSGRALVYLPRSSRSRSRLLEALETCLPQASLEVVRLGSGGWVIRAPDPEHSP